MALLIRTDGTECPLTLFPGQAIEDICHALGCRSIEPVSLGAGRVLFMDEDGKHAPKPRNELATLVARCAGIARDDYIAGDAVVCEREELR